jgi:hypothetical protein
VDRFDEVFALEISPHESSREDIVEKRTSNNLEFTISLSPAPRRLYHNVLYGPINAVEQGGGYSIVTSVGFVKNQCAPLTLASQPALEGVTFYGIRSENFSTIFDVLALGGGEFPKLWNWSQLGDV